MFEHPPGMLRPLWSALANISGWFDWSALEAIGTVGALWFAVVQSSRTARSERTGQVGTLTALIGLTEPITEGVPAFEDRDGDTLNYEEVAFLLGSRAIVQRGIDGLKRLPSAEISAVGATEYVSALSLTLEHILDRMPEGLNDQVRVSFMNDSSAYVAEACDFFRSQRDYIQYGWVGSRLNALLRAVQHRFWRWHYRRLQRQLDERSPPNPSPTAHQEHGDAAQPPA